MLLHGKVYQILSRFATIGTSTEQTEILYKMSSCSLFHNKWKFVWKYEQVWLREYGPLTDPLGQSNTMQSRYPMKFPISRLSHV
jgi:hypothetical protein